MADSVNTRVRKHREALRASGLRPVQLWLPDTSVPGFDAECHRQALLTARADANDHDLMDFLDLAAADIAGPDR